MTWRDILRDTDVYSADRTDDVLEARAHLAKREDAERREMLDVVDKTLAGHEAAETVAREAIAQASRGWSL